MSQPFSVEYPELYRDIVRHLPDALVVSDAEGTVRHANNRAGSLFGCAPDQLVGRPLHDLMPERFRRQHTEGFRRYVETRHARLFGTPIRVSARRVDGSEVAVELVLAGWECRDGPLVLGAFRDAREQIALERELETGRYLRATLEVTARLHDAHDGVEAVTRVLPTLCSNLDWDAGAIWLLDEDAERLRCLDFWHRADRPAAEILGRASREVSVARGADLPGRVWSKGRPVIVPDLTRDPMFARRAAASRRAGLVSGLALPLTTGRRLLGVIELFSAVSRGVDPDLVEVLAGSGRQIGQVLDRLRAEDALRELAATLQRSLLPPHLPEIPGVEIGAVYRAGGRGVSVGGDFYDVFAVDRDSWALVIGDVCGKGVVAAQVTGLARYAARAAAVEQAAPSRVLATINTALLRQSDSRRFLTACYLLLRPRSGWVDTVVAVAGHPLPLLLPAAGPIQTVGVPGQLLGVVAEPELANARIRLVPGDTLVLLTDGVTEARNRGGEQFGDRALGELLEQVRGAPAREVAARIGDAARAFETRRAQDDLAVLVVRVPSGG